MPVQLRVQPWHGQAASVWKLWLSPVSLLLQPSVANRARPFCGQKKPLLASQVTYRLINPCSHTAHSSVSTCWQSCLKNGKLGALYLCSGFTRWHYSMYVPEGTDTIKIPCKELCCRSKMALSSTSLKPKLSCFLIFSLPLHVRFRKKSCTSAVPNMT